MLNQESKGFGTGLTRMFLDTPVRDHWKPMILGKRGNSKEKTTKSKEENAAVNSADKG